jgi:hypothetical protein
MECENDGFLDFQDVYVYAALNCIARACSAGFVCVIQVEKVGRHDTFCGGKAVASVCGRCENGV